MTDVSTLLNQDIELDQRKYCEFPGFVSDEHLKELIIDLNYQIDAGNSFDGTESVIGKSPNKDILKKSRQCSLINPNKFWEKLKVQHWINFVCQYGNNAPMYTMTPVGGYYRAHFDHPQNGHFSNTLFLSDPETYEGGELEILVDGELKQFKPKAGTCITYETGLPHQVKTVTKGERRVLVWWTTTCIPVLQDLYAWRTLSELSVKDGGYYPLSSEDITDDLYEFVRKPHCIYAQAANNIIRKHMYEKFSHNTGI